jgi:hypothetical protein
VARLNRGRRSAVNRRPRFRRQQPPGQPRLFARIRSPNFRSGRTLRPDSRRGTSASDRGKARQLREVARSSLTAADVDNTLAALSGQDIADARAARVRHDIRRIPTSACRLFRRIRRRDSPTTRLHASTTDACARARASTTGATQSP